MSVVGDIEGGAGWRLVRPPRDRLPEARDFSPLVPDADWFWMSLQRFCVPACCGLDAYDFSAESVAWACGWGTTEPAQSGWRDDSPGDPRELARALRAAAWGIRDIDAEAVSAGLFNDILTPESYASLFEDLADKAEPRSASAG